MLWSTRKKDREATLKALSRIITELVLQRQDIAALKLQIEVLSKSREQMYNSLLQAFIKVVNPVMQTTPFKSHYRADVGLFDEVPLGDSEGYKEDELELEE